MFISALFTRAKRNSVGSQIICLDASSNHLFSVAPMPSWCLGFSRYLASGLASFKKQSTDPAYCQKPKPKHGLEHSPASDFLPWAQLHLGVRVQDTFSERLSAINLSCPSTLPQSAGSIAPLQQEKPVLTSSSNLSNLMHQWQNFCALSLSGS